MLTAVRAPETLIDVFQLLSHDPDAVLVGGGTTVVPRLTAGTAGHTLAVSLARLKESLKGIAVADGRAVVGAMTSLAALARHPALAFLAPALAHVGSPTLRATATIGGNFFVAAPYGDVAVAMIALDATCTLLGPQGEVRRSAEDVARDGVAHGDVLVSLAFALPEAGTFRFHKAARRRLNSAAVATVAAVVSEAGGQVVEARVALGGVAPTARRSPAAEAALVGRRLDAAAAQAAGEAALADAAPFTDAYASAWYRARVLPVHVRRALIDA